MDELTLIHYLLFLTAVSLGFVFSLEIFLHKRFLNSWIPFRLFTHILRQNKLFHFPVHQFFDLRKFLLVSFIDEGDGFALCRRTGSTSYPVNIVFRITGYVVVNHECDVFDVDTAR
jgi:hypothetical protein